MPRLAAVLAGVVRELGSASLPKRLAEALFEILRTRHLSVVAFDQLLAAHVVVAESAGVGTVAKAAGKIYESTLMYRHDPNVRVVGRAGAAVDEPLILRLRAREISNPAYRSRIYERFALVDRLSIVEQFAGHWHAINLYRDAKDGEFSDADLAMAQSWARLIVELMAKHLDMLPPRESQPRSRPTVGMLEQLLDRLEVALTPRQRQVCARALVGMTNAGIALDLGVRTPTVATLRSRAYSALGISSLNELFALCLARAVPLAPDTVISSDPH